MNISTIFEVDSPQKHGSKHNSSNFSPVSKLKFETFTNSTSLKMHKNDNQSIKMLKTEISPQLRSLIHHHENSPLSGAFPSFDQELKKRGIKDLKIFEVLSNVMRDGLNSLKQKMIYSTIKNKCQAQEFHHFCDKKAPLLFMIFLNSGFIFGGYIYAPLDESKSVMKDKLSGLFSFFGDKVFFYEVNNKEVKYESRGFSFGIPNNLLIDLEMMDESACNLELKYKSPLGAEVTFKISQNFVWSLMIKEICVYKLS